MLNEVGDDGHPYRKHLARAAAQGNERAAARLEGPGVPEGLEYLIQWFGELQYGRQVGFSTVQSISWSDLHGWAQVTGRTPTRMEALALMRIDLAMRFPSTDEDD